MAATYVSDVKLVTCQDCGRLAVHKTHSGSLTTWDPWEREYVTEPLSDGFSVECPFCGFADGEPPQY